MSEHIRIAGRWHPTVPCRIWPLTKRPCFPVVPGLLLVAISVLIGCSKNDAGEVSPSVAIEVATAQSGKIERTITTDAVVYPVRQAALTPKISAPVHKFFVERGSHVHAGQLLAQLENQDLVASVIDNEGAYEQAQAAYETATKQSMPEEIQKAELDAKAALDSRQVAEKLYTGQQNLFQQGATARKNVEDAKLAFIQASNQYDIARKHSESLANFGKDQELKAAKGQLASAQGRYLAAQAQLGFADVRSPISGVVTDRPLYTGEMAAAGSPLVTVMDISQVVARAHIDPRQAAALSVGNSARILVPELKDALTGRVTMVGAASDPGSTTLEIWVQAANPREAIRPGGTAQIDIVAETVRNAVLIPSTALLTAPDGQNSVMVIDQDNRANARAVKIGIEESGTVQVTSGLQVGERVATAGAYDLSKLDPDVLKKTKVVIENHAEAQPKAE